METTAILRAFDEHGVEYVLVGPAAAAVRRRGAPPAPTLDVCYRQRWRNCECLARALEQLDAEVVPARAVPIPLTGDLRKSREPIHLESPAGPFNLLPNVDGLGTYDDLAMEATLAEVAGGVSARVLNEAQIERWLQLTSQRQGLLDLLLARALREPRSPDPGFEG